MIAIAEVFVFTLCAHHYIHYLQDDLEPAREEFCPASSFTPSPSPDGFSMDFNTMDYNRLLKHFDLGGDDRPRGKTPRKGRRKSNGRRRTVSDRGDAASPSRSNADHDGRTKQDFGRRVLIGKRTTDESNEVLMDFGREMKRLRKRITV